MDSKKHPGENKELKKIEVTTELKKTLQRAELNRSPDTKQLDSSIYNNSMNKTTLISNLIQKCASRCLSLKQTLNRIDSKECITSCNYKYLSSFETGLEVFESFIQSDESQVSEMKSNPHSLY